MWLQRFQPCEVKKGRFPCLCSWDVLTCKWLFPLWRDGHCREIEITVNVRPDCKGKSSCCGEVAITSDLRRRGTH